jgi:hypothetical protein
LGKKKSRKIAIFFMCPFLDLGGASTEVVFHGPTSTAMRVVGGDTRRHRHQILLSWFVALDFRHLAD